MGDLELQLFSDRLKELRIEKGLTQAQFVDGLGITASALSAYEKNLKNPSISVAKRIAEKYDVSIDWLCGLSNKKSYSTNIETYSDLFRLLFDIDKNTTMSFDYINLSEDSFSPYYIPTISFNDELINNFIEEWKKMRTLYNDKIIDDDVYKLWLEKTLIKSEHSALLPKKE